MIIRNRADIPKALELLESSNLFSFDIETSGLSFRSDKVIGFGCATPTNLSGFYIIMREWVNGELVELLTAEDVLPVLRALETKELLGWNFAFDASFILYNYAVNLMPALYCEVMLMIHTCDESRFSYGLKQLSAEIFGESAAAAQSDLKESIKANGGSAKQYFMADSAVVAKYGLQDNILTCKQFNHWSPILRREGLEAFFYTDEVMPLLKNVTFGMQYYGLPVDVPYLQQSQTEIAADLEALEGQIQQQIEPLLPAFNSWYLNKEFPFKLTGPFAQALALQEGVRLPKTPSGAFSLTAKNIQNLSDCLFKRVMLGLERLSADKILSTQRALLLESGTKYAFNILSKDHLKRLFFGTPNTPSPLNEKALSTTDLGNPQVDDDFLDAMAAKYEWVKQLRVYNKLTKLKGTYIDRILEGQEDGIYYPQFFQHRTVSGRYGSDLQQMPRKLADGEPLVVKYTNRVRDFFIAGPGHKLVGADYESLEPKCFSHASGDERLRNIFRAGHDFYSTIAIDTERLKQYSPDKSAENYLGKLNKQKRQTAKAYALGVAYGMTGYKLQFELNIPEPEANRLVASYLAAYPDLANFMEQSRQFALKHGYVTTELGRKRRFPELKQAYALYGEDILHPLKVWERWNDSPAVYAKMKEMRKRCQNYLNNAINVKIQGLAASIVNRSAVATAAAYRAEKLDARIIMNIHDELVVLASNEHTERAAALLQHHMENTVKLSLPLTAEPCIADKYGDTK